MNILLTNDDGWNADGIQILYKRLLKDGHNAAICAPDRNRSGVSHSITMHKPLCLRRKAENVFACSGKPADCVIVGTRGSILPFVPDVVLAGINQGANIGTDTVYSGTVAAARQAVIYGYPAVALSISDPEWKNWKYDALADFAAKNLEKLVSLSVPCKNDKMIDGVFVNVNALSADTYKGVRFAKDLSFRDYCDSVEVIDGPDGLSYSFFIGGKINSFGSDENDAALCADGFISVSRIYALPEVAENLDEGEGFTL